MFRNRLTLLVFLLVTLASLSPKPLKAQSTATVEPEVTMDLEFPLTIKSIMRGPEWVGQSPRGIQWSDDSKWIYFQWLPGGGAWDDSPELYRVPA